MTVRRQKKIAEGPKSDIEGLLKRSDPRLGRVITAVIARIGTQRMTIARASPFEALARAIVYQSVSGHAAAAIYKRMRCKVKGPLSPRKILALRGTTLRAAGLSRAKMDYIRRLASWFDTHRMRATQLRAMPDEEIVDTLTRIPGVGRWTANVFLIFNLGRPDVVPADDLGIRRGVQLTYGSKSVPGASAVRKKAELWRPYRSVASMYLWQAVKLKLTKRDLS